MALLDSLGLSKKRWLEANVEPAQGVTENIGYEYGLGSSTVASLLGTGRQAARTRIVIYQKWMTMQADSVCSSALKILCTTALGGDPQTGQMVYLEKSAAAQKDAKLGKIADEIANDLTKLFNKVAYTACFTGAAMGDAYVRIFSEPKRGVIDLICDEMYLPVMVQAYEQGGRTVGYEVYSGKSNYSRLDVTQLARFKMPRTQWTPQPSIIQKSMRAAITENDQTKQPIMPSMIGGSFLFPAEASWENLTAAQTGLVGQRIRDSLDEAYLTVNLESATTEQQKRLLGSITTMLSNTKKIIADAIAANTPILGMIRHVFPVSNEKQISNITPMNSSRSNSITIEDVNFHARLTAGAIGVDLSLLGFSDQQTAVFGDGGISRASAQIAESSRIIRNTARDFFDAIIDVHTFFKYGIIFPDNQRPITVNFYSSISAFDAEQGKIKADTMNSGMLLIQALQMAKELGWTEEQLASFLTKQMMLDETEATLYAKMNKASSENDNSAINETGGE